MVSDTFAIPLDWHLASIPRTFGFNNNLTVAIHPIQSPQPDNQTSTNRR